MKTIRISLMVAASALLPATLAAQSAPNDANGPENLIPQPAEIVTQPVEVDDEAVVSTTVVDAIDAMAEREKPLAQSWSLANARALAAIIEGIGEDGLVPSDYNLAGLRSAIAAGANPQLDAVASKSFQFLVEDLRDGRTPMDGRKQWFVFDPDQDRYPTKELMSDALESGDIAGVLARIMPEHPDYFRLKQELAKTPASNTARKKLIRANMDRWRWLARDLGSQYLITNVPEYQLRLTVNDKIVRTYRTVVGKPGRTATPQIAESVEGVIFNPTWTVPQSIVKGEGLGARVLGNPAWARSKGYTATRGANGWVNVVQQPGPGNSLGLMKLDMPNRHAIFFHDTPSRHLFNSARRALSHGCIRTERATELAITLAILQGGLTADESVAKLKSGKYTKVPFNKTMPAYITYFTMAQDIDGKLRTFPDIYGRDAAVLDAMDAPRKANRSRVTGEQIIPIENDPRDLV
ncbi:L,D-transpeptidase family protein [Pontixanthobacter aquaemixtae]|uniref:L,D-transpeptidase family protein n=1 Tax=Pontixanthobacter aquaemixtae TaxID=1958940 RepID=A0A844ZV80_9SPHN|nr:L,D-transpeptidase family protein [Pontixanthobacter aquaemixtae]MXO91775.1 L,D-transpeptidase family protein [Pontixanthobacter aquaemixtae]